MTNTYAATESHMREAYVSTERARDDYFKSRGMSYNQTDEELGAEFDRGLATLKARAIREASDTLAMKSTAPTRWMREIQTVFCDAATALEKEARA